MSDQIEAPEWLTYFIKRPVQGILMVTATIMFFIALFLFLRDVQQIEASHISIEDGANIIRYTTDSLLVVIPTTVIFFFVGVAYTVEHGNFGPYIAWVVIGVGLLLLMIAAVEHDPGVRFICSNAGWVAFSAGFGFFAGVQVEKTRRTSKDAAVDDAAHQIDTKKSVVNGKRNTKVAKT